MANNPVWHNIFRYIVLKPDNITFEADNYKDSLNIIRGPGVNWGGSTSNLDISGSSGTDQFMINVDYDISVPVATTDITLEDVNGNTSSITFTAGRGIEIVRNSAQELEWRSYSVTETDTLQTVTERNNITNNKIFINNIEVGTISSSFTEDGFPSYDPGYDLAGNGTLDSPLKFSPEYKDSIAANYTEQFTFTALGPGNLAYSASYVCGSGATTASVTLEREDPSNPGTWVVLDLISGVTLGYSYAIQGIYSELYSGNVNYRLTYTWTGNLGVVTWHIQNTFEGGAYTPINDPQIKTDTDAKTVDINDLQFFQNNIRTTVSNTDIVLDPAGTGKVVALSDITAPTFTGDLSGNVTGNVTGNLFGNADTVSNGVYTNISYADPSWITSLDAAKIIGDIQLRSFVIDNSIRIDGTLIETIVSNANLELRANGTGKVITSNDMIVNEVTIGKGLGNVSSNTVLGRQAFNTNTSTNGYSTAIGSEALYSNTTGWANTALGWRAMYGNIGGTSNVALGYYAMYLNSSGGENVAVGNQALQNNSSGQYNVAVGNTASFNNLTEKNTAIGFQSFFYNKNGSENVGLGYRAGLIIDGGSNNVIIGSNADTATATDNNCIVIGRQAVGLGSNTIVIGNASHTSATINGALTATSIQNTPIGSSTRAAGNFTSFDANSTVGLSPANANVTISPTGTGIVTINPNTAGTINNMSIGGTTAAAGTFTTLTANSTTKVQQIKEKVISGTAPAATETISLLSGAVYRYANNNANDWILNFRGDGSTTMNTFLSTDESTTVTLITKNAGTAWKNTSVRVDGTTSGVTVVWLSGSAYPAGNTNSTDIYTYTIIKTAASTYTVIASQTRYG